jgi:hypothetical protein
MFAEAERSALGAEMQNPVVLIYFFSAVERFEGYFL